MTEEVKVRSEIGKDEDTIFSCLDAETAALNLEFLKERCEFHNFFGELESSWQRFLSNGATPFCQELRCNDETDDGYALRIHMMHVKGIPFWGGRGQEFGLFDRFIPTVQCRGIVSTDTIINLLNPANRDFDWQNDALEDILPKLFALSSVKEVGRCRGLTRSPDGKLEYRRYQYNISTEGIRPEERIIKIDLSKNTGQIKKEIDFFLKKEKAQQRCSENFSEKLEKEGSKHKISVTWSARDGRNQLNARKKQLEAWRLKVEGLSFSDIALRQGEAEDTVKRQFYSAFEEINGEPYSKNVWRELFKQKLENLILNSNKDENIEHIKKYQKLTETSRKEPLIDDLRKYSDRTSDVSSDSGQGFDFTALMVGDIRKICSNCPDKECSESSIRLIDEGMQEDLPPCPAIYKYLLEEKF